MTILRGAQAEALQARLRFNARGKQDMHVYFPTTKHSCMTRPDTGTFARYNSKFRLPFLKNVTYW